MNRLEPLDAPAGVTAERTGLHQLEFIETIRHRSKERVLHYTHGSVNVLNLVDGGEAVIESPTGAFSPFTVHYAETFIIPEWVKAYTIRPSGQWREKEIATIKARVRV